MYLSRFVAVATSCIAGALSGCRGDTGRLGIIAGPPGTRASEEAASCDQVTLKIQHIGQDERRPVIEATLTNFGELPVRLVEPGDDSDRGLRTPALSWTVSPDVDRILVLGCGHTNSIRREEVFTLGAGESHRLPWTTAPPLHPGAYTLQLRYHNDPLFFTTGPGAVESAEEDASPQGIVSPDVQRIIEATADCVVVSNVLELVVP